MGAFSKDNPLSYRWAKVSIPSGNETMESDVSRRGFAFASGMTYPFDVAILSILISSSSPYSDH